MWRCGISPEAFLLLFPTANGLLPAIWRLTRLFFAVDRSVYLCIDHVRGSGQPWDADRIQSVAGVGRRRVTTLEPGYPAGRLSTGKAGTSDDPFRDCRTIGTGGWAYSGGIHHG
jgi:hypothetical protein